MDKVVEKLVQQMRNHRVVTSVDRYRAKMAQKEAYERHGIASWMSGGNGLPYSIKVER